MPNKHVEITNAAASAAGMSPAAAAALAEHVRAVDFWDRSQDVENSHMHHMCRPWEGFQCQIRYWRLIRKFEVTCNETDFWAAMHAVQDSYSPSHREFQVWKGPPEDLVGFFGLAPHFFGDLSGIGQDLAVQASLNLIKIWQKKCKCAK